MGLLLAKSGRLGSSHKGWFSFWGPRHQHRDLPWRGMAGMRDLLIHAYDRVDLEEVWQAYQQFPAIRKRMLEILNATDLN